MVQQYIVNCDPDGINRNAEHHSRYTRSRLPVSLEYWEEQPNQSMALKRELAIKALSRKAKEALIQVVKGRDSTK